MKPSNVGTASNIVIERAIADDASGPSRQDIGGSAPFTQVASLPLTATSYVDNSAAVTGDPGKKYDYRAVLYGSSAAVSGYSNIVFPNDIMGPLPTVIKTIVGSMSTASKYVTLTWDPTTDQSWSGVSRYEIYRKYINNMLDVNGKAIQKTFTADTCIAGNKKPYLTDTTFKDDGVGLGTGMNAGLKIGTSYCYHVVAYDSNNNKAPILGGVKCASPTNCDYNAALNRLPDTMSGRTGTMYSGLLRVGYGPNLEKMTEQDKGWFRNCARQYTTVFDMIHCHTDARGNITSSDNSAPVGPTTGQLGLLYSIIDDIAGAAGQTSVASCLKDNVINGNINLVVNDFSIHPKDPGITNISPYITYSFSKPAR